MVIHDLKHPVEMLLSELSDIEVKCRGNVSQNKRHRKDLADCLSDF
jgi:hypothetical protein